MKKPLNQFFDHTLLKPDASAGDIVRLCREAKEYGFFAVCVNSCYVELSAEVLEGSGVCIASVIGFPLGASSDSVKAYETDFACDYGAREIDMVVNIGALKDRRNTYVRDEIAQVTEIARDYGASVKVILETCLLTDAEIIRGCKLAEEGGAAFVKTSTGFSTGGASPAHVALMKKAVGDRLQVKASGGIRDLKTCMAMIDAGADRIGASASVTIMKEYEERIR